jgi:hypothetical protein
LVKDCASELWGSMLLTKQKAKRARLGNQRLLSCHSDIIVHWLENIGCYLSLAMFSLNNCK